LRVDDTDRLELMIVLVGELGWVQVDQRGVLRLASSPATAWLQTSPTVQREVLSDAWIESGGFRELPRIPSLITRDTAVQGYDPRLARRAVVRHLSSLAPTAWYQLGEYIRDVKRVDPDFQRPDGDYDSWYVQERDSGLYLRGFESWDAVEGGILRYLMGRPLAWLGLVAVAPSGTESGQTAFQLTEQGAAYLDLVEEPVRPEVERLRVDSDFTIHVPPGRRFERFQLERVADWTSTGDPYVYRIGPSSLARGASESIGVDRVIDFLHRSCRPPVPRPVLEALSRWESHGAQARLASVDLLTVSDAEIMTQIVQSPAASRYIRERIGPAAATVRRGDWNRLIRELAKLAILPEVKASGD
jgi:hypothetical protein